ncbi:radical SAM protein [Nocardia niigatensis]
MKHISLIVKATRLCNLRCSYCHDWAAGPGLTMRFPVLAAMTRQALAESDYRSVDFIWHGGETTLMPMDFYRKAIFLQERYRHSGQRVRNIIQTNGTLLTETWAEFFAAYQFKVGVSLDGPPEIHDRYRRHSSGRPSFADVVAGVELLRRHKVPFTVLMVLSEQALHAGPGRVFDTFLNLGVNSYSLISVKPENIPHAQPGTPAEPYLDPGTMTQFMCELYDLWRAHGDDRVVIRELCAIESRLSGLEPGICTLAGDCLGHYFLVEPSGQVAHCDLFLGDPRYSLGNVLTNSFEELAASQRLADLRAENRRALNRLRKCPEFGICNGWCPHERYLSVRHNPNHRADCCGLRDLIQHVRTRLHPGPADQAMLLG